MRPFRSRMLSFTLRFTVHVAYVTQYAATVTAVHATGPGLKDQRSKVYYWKDPSARANRGGASGGSLPPGLHAWDEARVRAWT